MSIEVSPLLRKCVNFFEILSGLLFSVCLGAGHHDFIGWAGEAWQPSFGYCPSPSCYYYGGLMRNSGYPQPSGVISGYEEHTWNVFYRGGSAATVFTGNCAYGDNHDARVKVGAQGQSVQHSLSQAYSALGAVAPGVQRFEVEMAMPYADSKGSLAGPECSQYWNCNTTDAGGVVCKKELSRPVEKEHYKFVDYEGKTYSRCLLCNPENEELDCKRLRYKGLGAINMHYKTHFKVREYWCPMKGCIRCFSSRQNLRTHILKHQGKKQFSCTYKDCTGTFTTANSLRNHIRLHRNEKPFVCKYIGCTKAYVDAKGLKRHANSHSRGRFNCMYCYKEGNDKHNMLKHELSCERNPQGLPVRVIRQNRKRIREAGVVTRAINSTSAFITN